MEDFDEKLNEMTNEIINYMGNTNLSIEILHFLDNNFEGEKLIKGFNFFKKINISIRSKNIELNFLR